MHDLVNALCVIVLTLYHILCVLLDFDYRGHTLALFDTILLPWKRPVSQSNFPAASSVVLKFCAYLVDPTVFLVEVVTGTELKGMMNMFDYSDVCS